MPLNKTKPNLPLIKILQKWYIQTWNLWEEQCYIKMSWFYEAIYKVFKCPTQFLPVKLSCWRPKGSFFNSYYTEVYGRVLLLSLDYSTLPLICTLYCWELSKVVSSTIFKVFGTTRPGIEPRSLRPLANTLPTRPMSRLELSLLISMLNKYAHIFMVVGWH